jgi:penicillin-binding protein 1A
MDNPKPLGKYETGSKTALPIFKNFVKKAVKNQMQDHLKLLKDYNDGCRSLTGQKAKFSSKNTIIEAYKSKNVLMEKFYIQIIID